MAKEAYVVNTKIIALSYSVLCNNTWDFCIQYFRCKIHSFTKYIHSIGKW